MEIEKVEVNVKPESWESFKKRNNIDYDWIVEVVKTTYPNKIAEDYAKNSISIDNETYTAKMSRGGGFVLIF